jgi:hypothetical protein
MDAVPASDLGLCDASAGAGSAVGPVGVAVGSDSDGGEASPQAAAWLAGLRRDFAWRNAMVLKMRQDGHVHGAEEAALIAKGCAVLDLVSGTGKVRMLRHSRTVMSAWTKHDKKSGMLLGRMELVIRASAEQIIAYQMNFDSNIKLSQRDATRELRYEILEVKNLHHIVVFYERKMAPGFDNRTFLQSLVWRKVSDAPPAFIFVNVATGSHDKVPPERESHAVRAEGTRYLRLTQVGDDVTRVDYACALDLKGTLPQWLTNRQIPQLMRVPYDLQTYFLQVRRPSECSVDDGTYLGQMLVDAAEAAQKRDRASAISTFVMRTAMLRECGLPNLDAMLIGILAKHAVTGVRSKHVGHMATSNPATLSVADMETIGLDLRAIVGLSATHVEAVEAFLRKYPALAVAAHRHVWFRPMLETVAKCKQCRASTQDSLRRPSADAARSGTRSFGVDSPPSRTSLDSEPWRSASVDASTRIPTSEQPTVRRRGDEALMAAVAALLRMAMRRSHST